MFGYVKTDIPNMYVKDTVLYKATYCGLCKSIGKLCGQRARLVLNYDLTFLSLFCHNLADTDVKIEKQYCIIHRLKKRPVAVPDELSERVAALNIILAWYKLKDDVLDNGKGRLKRSFFKKAYKKSKKKEPILDRIVSDRFDELLSYEKSSGKSIDMAADPFGNMMKDITAELLYDKSTDAVKELAYSLGKWIYLIDALDDFDKDKKKKNFNVFINSYPDIKDKTELIEKHRKDLAVVFGTVLNIVSVKADELEYNFNHDLIDNVLKHGLIEQTKKIMEKCKCQKTTKYSE